VTCVLFRSLEGGVSSHPINPLIKTEVRDPLVGVGVFKREWTKRNLARRRKGDEEFLRHATKKGEEGKGDKIELEPIRGGGGQAWTD